MSSSAWTRHWAVCYHLCDRTCSRPPLYFNHSSAAKPKNSLQRLAHARHYHSTHTSRYPEVFFHEPVSLTQVTVILTHAVGLISGQGPLSADPSVQASKQGKFR